MADEPYGRARTARPTASTGAITDLFFSVPRGATSLRQTDSAGAPRCGRQGPALRSPCGAPGVPAGPRPPLEEPSGHLHRWQSRAPEPRSTGCQCGQGPMADPAAAPLAVLFPPAQALWRRPSTSANPGSLRVPSVAQARESLRSGRVSGPGESPGPPSPYTSALTSLCSCHPPRPAALTPQLPCAAARLRHHAIALVPHLAGHPHIEHPPGRHHRAGDAAEHHRKG